MTRPRQRRPRPAPGAHHVGLVPPVPEPLRVRDRAVWATGDGDVLAAARWRAAGAAWRTEARRRGHTLEATWVALDPDPTDLMAPDEQRLTWMLEGIGRTSDDLPELAAQARELWPDLFADGWPDQAA